MKEFADIYIVLEWLLQSKTPPKYVAEAMQRIDIQPRDRIAELFKDAGYGPYTPH